MTKATMVKKILDDMHKKDDAPDWQIDARWKRWLNRQTNLGLEMIMQARGLNQEGGETK